MEQELLDYTINDVVSSSKFTGSVLDKENSMETLKVSNKLYQLLNIIREDNYPLHTLIRRSGFLYELTRDLSPVEEDLVMEYLAYGDDVEVEVVPDTFTAKKGDTIIINGGTPITLDKDIDITGFEEI